MPPVVGYNRFPDEKGTESEPARSVQENQEPVTTVSPMKRGLKVADDSDTNSLLLSYNRFPDEKGTESIQTDAETAIASVVTTVSPMKRGLKAPSFIQSIGQ